MENKFLFFLFLVKINNVIHCLFLVYFSFHWFSPLFFWIETTQTRKTIHSLSPRLKDKYRWIDFKYLSEFLCPFFWWPHFSTLYKEMNISVSFTFLIGCVCLVSCVLSCPLLTLLLCFRMVEVDLKLKLTSIFMHSQSCSKFGGGAKSSLTILTCLLCTVRSGNASKRSCPILSHSHRDARIWILIFFQTLSNDKKNFRDRNVFF